MNDKGFVKLNRRIKDKAWYGENGTLRIYLAVLLGAAWKDFEYDGMTLHKGQYVTSLAKLAEHCGLTIRQTRTAISHLKATHDIAVQSTAKYSIITLNDDSGDSSGDKRADNLGDTLSDIQSDNRNRTEKEDKEIKKEERKEAAAPPAPSSRSSNSLNPGITKDELVAKYGEDNVSLYELKFDNWAAKKGISDFSNMYGVIAKWLAEDKVSKPQESSFNMGDVMQNIISRYKP